MNLNEENTEKKTANKSSILITILSFLLVVSIVFIIILLMKQRPAEASNDTTITEQSEPVEKLEDSINIPGYTMLSFKAGELNQQVTIPNAGKDSVKIAIASGFVLLFGTGTFMYLKKKKEK